MCTKAKTTNSTCVLCNGEHPANSKGCIVYKEVPKRKFPTLRLKINVAFSAPPPSFNTKNFTPIRNSQSEPQGLVETNLPQVQTTALNHTPNFATSLRGNVQQNQHSDNVQVNYENQYQNQNESKIMLMLSKILDRMDENMKRIDKLIDLLVTILSRNH